MNCREWERDLVRLISGWWQKPLETDLLSKLLLLSPIHLFHIKKGMNIILIYIDATGNVCRLVKNISLRDGWLIINGMEKAEWYGRMDNTTLDSLNTVKDTGMESIIMLVVINTLGCIWIVIGMDMVSYFITIFKGVIEFASGNKYEGNFE